MLIRHFINEGLIAVPPRMAEHIDFLLTFALLWKMRDRFKGKSKALPEHYKAFKALVAEFGEKLPAEPYKANRDISVTKIPVDLRGMPPTYAHLTPTTDSIFFVIDWRPEQKSHGVWHAAKDALGINPLSWDYLVNYPSARNHPDDLKIALTAMRETLNHELRHMVQSVILGAYPKQAEMKPGYGNTDARGNRTADYWTSPVELDPMIGSATNEFLFMWDTVNNGREAKPYSLSRSIKRFVGAEKTGSFDPFSANDLFKMLKRHEPDTYRIAVRKFVMHLQAVMQARSVDPKVEAKPLRKRAA